MAAMPVGEAQRGREDRRIGGIELAEQPEMRATVDRDVAGRERREVRDVAVEPEEKRGIARDGIPAKATFFVKRGGAIVPRQQARMGLVGECGDAVGVGAERVGAVQSRAGKKRLRQNSSPAGRALIRQRGDKGSEVRPRSVRSAAATTPRQVAARARR